VAVWAGNRGTISEKRRLSTVRAEIPPLPWLEWVLMLGTSFLGQLYAAIARPKPLAQVPQFKKGGLVFSTG
jgi:hypothetical protein